MHACCCCCWWQQLHRSNSSAEQVAVNCRRNPDAAPRFQKKAAFCSLLSWYSDYTQHKDFSPTWLASWVSIFMSLYIFVTLLKIQIILFWAGVALEYLTINNKQGFVVIIQLIKRKSWLDSCWHTLLTPIIVVRNNSFNSYFLDLYIEILDFDCQAF